MQCRSDGVGAQVSLPWSMVPLTYYKLFLWLWWEMSGRWRWAGAQWICCMSPHVTRYLVMDGIHNHHLRISHPLGSRRIPSFQASPFPPWLLSQVSHLLIWPEPWWIVGDSNKSLGELPLSYWTLYSDWNQHALCFCMHFHTWFVWGVPATRQCRAWEEPTKGHAWVHDTFMMK